MAIYRTPRSGDEQPKHHPQFIYIDETKERAKRQESLHKGKAEYIEKLQRLDSRKYPFIFRFLSLLWCFAFAAGAVLLFLLVVLLMPIALLLLLRYRRLNAYIQKQWSLMCKLVVFAFGSLFAVVNPPYGFGIIILFFMLKGEDAQNNPLLRLIIPIK